LKFLYEVPGIYDYFYSQKPPPNETNEPFRYATEMVSNYNAINLVALKSPALGLGINGRPCTNGGCLVALSEPRNHADVHGVVFGDRGQGFTGRTALDGFVALIGRELGLAAKLDAVRHGAPATLAGALAYQVAVKVGDCGE
jgi:hypothetical protein